MNAEYVISEMNGLATYSYSLTAATAHCRSQPQNWSTFESDFENHQQLPWNREVSSRPRRTLTQNAWRPGPLEAVRWFLVHRFAVALETEGAPQSRSAAGLSFTKVSQIR